MPNQVRSPKPLVVVPATGTVEELLLAVEATTEDLGARAFFQGENMDSIASRPSKPVAGGSKPSGRAEFLGYGSRCTVASYARLNAWLDLRDIEQQAALVALEERQTWRPNGGSTEDRWEAWKVGLALSRFVAENRCPVSLPKRKGESWDAAAGSRRVSDGQEDDDSGEMAPVCELAGIAAEQFVPLEEVIDQGRAIERLRGVLARESAAALEMLLSDDTYGKAGQVAARHGLSVRQVYDQTARAMRALREAFQPSMDTAR